MFSLRRCSIVAGISVCVLALLYVIPHVSYPGKAEAAKTSIAPIIRDLGYLPNLGDHYYQGRSYTWVSAGHEVIRAARNCEHAEIDGFKIRIAYLDLGLGQPTAFVVMCRDVK